MSETIEITRYPNRRLYDRSCKQYVTVGEIEAMVLSGKDVRIRDNKTQEDLTRVVLMQILVERHPERLKMFPIAFLHELLRADQLALDWLTVYLGQARTMMRGFADSTAAPLAPGIEYWQSLLSGMIGGKVRPEPSSDDEVPASDESQREQDLLKRLAELEARLKQLEKKQNKS